MELLFLFPWATDKVAEIGLKAFVALAVTGSFILISKGEFAGVIPVVVVSYILCWGFAHAGYIALIAALWLWRTIPQAALYVIKQREAAYLKVQREIAGRDMYLPATEPVEDKPQPVEEPDEWLEFLQRFQEEEAERQAIRRSYEQLLR
jgi:hypothetical protein